MKSCSIIIAHYSLIDDFDDGRFEEGKKFRSELMKECLESLFQNTDYPADIIVVDNGGSPDDSDYLIGLVRQGKINTYIRNKNNMGFGYSWNQGARLATGNYLCFTCNDILFKPKWLSTCIELLEKYKDKRLFASPFINRDKNNASCNKGTIDGNKLNSLAGSNCMVMDYQTYKDSGEFPHHRVGGSIWQRRMIRNGYLAICPPENLAEHIGEGKGINFTKQFYVNKTLLNGETINFNYGYDNPHKDYYYGFFRISGSPLGNGTDEERIFRCGRGQETDTPGTLHSK